jgi:hypothetical protein
MPMLSRLSLEQTTIGLTGTLQQGSDGIGISALGADNNIFLSTNGVQHFNLTSGGDVGIGTTSPSSALHVSGFAVIQKDNLNNSQPLTVANYDFTDGATQTTTMGFGLVRDSNGIKNKAGLITVGKERDWTADDAHLDSYMAFSILDGMVSKEKVRIDSDGNVGIGVEVPAAPLDVVSTVGGVIMPRMTTTEMNAIAAPSNGEMIYNTTTNKFAGYAGGAWETITSA